MNALEVIDSFNEWLSHKYADCELDAAFYIAFDKAMEMIQDDPEYWFRNDKSRLWRQAQNLI